MPSLIFWLPQTKIKYAATEKICFDIILETNFHEAKAVPVHENLRTHIQRCRVPRQGERGGKGFAGKTKKSRLAEWRALVNFLVVPAIWRRGRDYKNNIKQFIKTQHVLLFIFIYHKMQLFNTIVYFFVPKNVPKFSIKKRRNFSLFIYHNFL